MRRFLPLLPSTCPRRPARGGHRTRRGVLLLVVLSLLVLFTLVGVTFVLVASQSRRSMRADSRGEQYGDDPQKQLDSVFAQLVRDTANPQSVLRGHSLLADIYGNDGAFGTVTSVTVTPGNPFVDLMATTITSLLLTPAQLQTPGYFNGCVLTITSAGVAKDLSMRIVGYGFSAGTYTIRVMPPDGIAVASFSSLPGSTFIINGRPFNGTGFGFDPTALANSAPTLLSASYTITPSVGLPVQVPSVQLPNPEFVPPVNVGGADEDYDAPDLQNMLLASMPLNVPTALPPPGTPSSIIPSLHRGDLIWFLKSSVSPTIWSDPTSGPQLLRSCMLRPMGPMTIGGAALPFPAANIDHPSFTGSNPAFDALSGPWDVDNDGDGVADSIWVDAGFPVQTGPDGRRFKPLVAILTLDLDGRLNVNAHGNIAHVDTNPAFDPLTNPGNATGFYFAPPAGAVLNYQRGQGYGPADIRLNPTSGLPSLDFATAAKVMAARYQEQNSNLLVAAPTYYSANPPQNPYPGITSFDPANPYEDPWSAVKQFELPFPPFNKPNAFGSPMDMWGRGFTALDVRGTPLTPFMGIPTDRYDDPYEFNLSRRAMRNSVSPAAPVAVPPSPGLTPNPVDSPFSVDELEAILRYYDIDTGVLSNRLRALLLANTTLSMQQLRTALTTDSFDLPNANVLPTRNLRLGAAAAGISPPIGLHISDLLRIRLAQYGVTATAAVNAELLKMLPPELVAGQRMDVNRPLGNGQDDDGNGIVDEPFEVESQMIWNPATNVPAAFGGVAPALANGIDVNQSGGLADVTDNYLARQLYARHLYVLMMMLVDQAAQIPIDGEGTTAQEETARAIAQWAVNVVDFRDRDSIMTPFEYDVNPFNGWSVDGNLTAADPDSGNPERRVVWGCERPELRITETLAFHDRRTEDMPDDDSGAPSDHKKYNFSPMGNQDNSFDQRFVPMGSLFIELYNPWTTQASSTSASGYPNLTEVPGEFYDVKSGTVTGVILDRRTPDGTGNTTRFSTGSPVWRMLIVKGSIDPTTRERKDPDDPFPANRPIANYPAQLSDDVERSIYFVDITNIGATLGTYLHGQAYYSSLQPAPVLPGRYAVVGSAGFATAGAYTTPIGRPTGFNPALADYSTCRRIVLSPNTNPSVNQVQIFNNDSTEPAPIGGGGGNAQPAVAAVIDHALGEAYQRSVSVSEPPGGYLVPTGAPIGLEPTYAPIKNNPLDEAPANANPDLLPVFTNGTKTNFRSIYLQRLANPLVPYDPVLNPYLTIDAMSVDLTVFNGIYTGPAAEPAIPAPAVPPRAGFASLQLGDNDPANALGTQNNLWRHEHPNVNPVQTATLTVVANQIYPYFLQHTLGYLNKFAISPVPTNANTNAFPAGNPNGPQYVGAPSTLPFPWLTWNNRPFAGPTEILQVPKSRSSRLLYDYAPNPAGTFYTGPTTPPGISSSGHLPDFFWTAPYGTNAAHFYRILEYLQVPSRFVGAETYLSPASVSGGLPNEQGMFSLFHPPFNKVSNYRDPGRVNINTIPSNDATGSTSSVWDSILNNPAGAGTPTWAQINASRAGGAAIGSSPTMIANPFRSPGGAALTIPGSPNLPRDDVDVTLLRPLTPTTNVPNDPPLFMYASLNSYDDTNRNPYFRYQTLQRLSNLLTTRSNVYAVWITVGYFEVTPNPGGVDVAHPDGFQLGAELGSDSGEVSRHRAFYIYDRTIPVGFEPGRDHNINEGVLLKRYIE